MSDKAVRQPFRVVSDNITHSTTEESPSKKAAVSGGRTQDAATQSNVTPFPSMSSSPSAVSDCVENDQSHAAKTTNLRRTSTSLSVSSTASKINSPSSSSIRLDGVLVSPVHNQSLGSALGINTTSSSAPWAGSPISSSIGLPAMAANAAKRITRVSHKQSGHLISAPPPAWARRPSLPSMPSMGNRMSVASVSSFDSLPEGESIPHFATSPLSRSSQGPHRTSSEDGDKKRSSSSERGRALASATATKMGLSSPPGSDMPSADAIKKRRHLAMELLHTEQVYVASLRLINDNYYQPLAALSRGTPSSKVEALSSAAPVLSRKAINEIFSNFVDILHLNVELLSVLDERLSGRSRETPCSRPVSIVTSASDSPKPTEESRPWDAEADSVGDLLLPMAPFLKMYSLYVKNFSSALTRIENERKSNDSFARFLRETEQATWGRASNQGGFGFGLGFQAHLLTIVQRIPRYRLLVGDLVRCTPSSHRDYSDLCKAYAVIDQVAASINDHIRQHEMILVMLGIQRSLVGLTEPLITPGRSLLKRSTLLKACRKNIQSREFFLFTDCLVYASPISGSIDAASAAWQVLSRYGVPDGALMSPFVGPAASPRLPTEKGSSHGDVSVSPPQSHNHIRIRTRTMSGPSPYDAKRLSTSLDGQQLQFRAKFNLQDCTVVAVDDVVSPDPWLRHCLEIRTPGKSFAVYAETFESKMQWLTAIRTARDEYLSNRRTLQAEEDSIQAKRDRRRSLQVIASVQRTSMAATRKSSLGPDCTASFSLNDSTVEKSLLGASLSSSSTSTSLLRGDSNLQAILTGSAHKSRPLKVLDEYNAPVWVPDSRADRCACCNESFGIWRRKHHCRLCGQVVCWACSSKTFLIASYEEGEEDRPARSCDTCYESVFPDTPEATPCISAANSTRDTSLHRPSIGRPDSEISINSPPTPTSPGFSSSADTRSASTDAIAAAAESTSNEVVEGTTAEASKQSDSASTPVSCPPQPVSTGYALPAFPRRYSQMAAKVSRPKGAEALLFSGKLLSPHVQAATSGLGTFRLVTPRLTTPEHERASNDYTHVYVSSSQEQQQQQGAGHPAAASVPMTDYFAGALPGQSELQQAQGASQQAAQHPSSASSSSCESGQGHVPRLVRKKPLSAAARLSFFYKGAGSPSLTSLSSSPNK